MNRLEDLVEHSKLDDVRDGEYAFDVSAGRKKINQFEALKNSLV